MDEVVVCRVGETRVQHHGVVGDAAQVDRLAAGQWVIDSEQDALGVVQDRSEAYSIHRCRCAGHTHVRTTVTHRQQHLGAR